MNFIENPSAFPGANDSDKQYNWINRGMTLRDYFAAKAIIAYHADGTIGDGENAASWCYMMADAMLKAREA